MQDHANRWFYNIPPANAMAAIAIGAMLIFSVSGMKAFADNVQDDIDASVSSSQTLTAGGDGLTVKYWIVANGQGGFSGCDASDGSPVTVKFEVRKDGSTALTNDVTATPSSQSFSSCGSENAKTTTYKSDTPGIYKVSVSASDSAGSYNTNPAEFTLTVKAAADTTAPVLTLPDDKTVEATSADGAEVTYEATAEDAVDGSVDVSCTPESGSTFPLGETTVNCSATDAAGNEATGSFIVTVQDTIKPEIQVTSTISDGQQFYFGDVPSAPTCTATDSGSGVNGDGCKVSGHVTTVGPQTLTFTATDNAGNTATQTIKYTVLPWTIKGFYQPVDMNGVQNTVKGGSTVPLKFEVFKGSTEITATSAIVTPLKASKVTCDSGSTLDEIEILSSGSTVLRYDSTAGQFIYNWQTPKQPGACYEVKIGTIDLSSSNVAEFKLR